MIRASARYPFCGYRLVLWALGGVALISGVGRFSPGADIRVTAAGPLVTLVLAAVFAPLAFLAAGSGWPDWLLGLLAFLAVANSAMLVFNLVPVFPLDAVGAIVPFIVGLRPLDGTFIMFNAALLLTAAYAIRPAAPLRPVSLRARQVSDLLTPQPVLPSPRTPVRAFLDGLTREGGQGAAAYRVIDDGKVVGVVSPAMAADALADGRTVAEVMVRKEQAVMLTPEMSIQKAYAALGEEPAARAVVLADGRVVGIVRRSDLADALLEAREAEHGSVVPASPPRLRVDW